MGGRGVSHLANRPQSPQQAFFSLERDFGLNLFQIRLVMGATLLCEGLNTRGSFLAIT